jgi:Delta-aminolevulinic acid dehydratase
MVTFDRHRRLRSSAAMRDLVRENHLEKSDLIMPVFVDATIQDKEEIASMPGIYRYSLNTILDEIKEIVDLGIQSIIIFGIPDHKDDVGTGAWEDNGIVQEAIRKIKAAYPELIVIADTCMCEYTSTGHCGIVKAHKVLNDESLEYNTKVAVSQVKAGADMVAPSNAMDGFVAAIREGLDKAGLQKHQSWLTPLSLLPASTVHSVTLLMAHRSLVIVRGIRWIQQTDLKPFAK